MEKEAKMKPYMADAINQVYTSAIDTFEMLISLTDEERASVLNTVSNLLSAKVMIDTIEIAKSEATKEIDSKAEQAKDYINYFLTPNNN